MIDHPKDNFGRRTRWFDFLEVIMCTLGRHGIVPGLSMINSGISKCNFSEFAAVSKEKLHE